MIVTAIVCSIVGAHVRRIVLVRLSRAGMNPGQEHRYCGNQDESKTHGGALAENTAGCQRHPLTPVYPRRADQAQNPILLTFCI